MRDSLIRPSQTRRVARLKYKRWDRAGRHLAKSLIAGEDAAQGKEGQAGLAGLVQRR